MLEDKIMDYTEEIEKKKKLLRIAPYILSGGAVSLFSAFLTIIFFVLHDKIWILFAIGFVIGQILIAMGYIKFYKK